MPAPALTLAFDAGAEMLDPVIENADPKIALIGAKCLGLLMGYDRRWRNSPYLIDDVECVLTSDLYNPETMRKSRSFTIAGKIDVRATEMATGAKVIFDHKTCSQDIVDPNATYWQQLVIEGQVSQYMLLEFLNKNKVDKAIWDVVRKPGISPKGLAKKDYAAVVETGGYFGYTLRKGEVESMEDDPRETPLMYAARLANDCSFERPEYYFQRRAVARLDSEIVEYAQELWGHSQDLLQTRQSGRWPRNSGACFTYSTPCKFLGLCSGHDTIDSGNWSAKEWVHPELPIMGGRGLEILTNSRIRTFQTCRRKHQLQYEMGVEKTDEEEREALFFGNTFHAALEQYFLALQQQQRKGTA